MIRKCVKINYGNLKLQHFKIDVTVKSSQKFQDRDGGEAMTMEQEQTIQKGKNGKHIFTPKL